MNRVLIYTDPGAIHSRRFLTGLASRVDIALFWWRRSGDGRVFTGARQFPSFGFRFNNIRTIRELQWRAGVKESLSRFKPDLIHVHVDALACSRFKAVARQKPCIFTAWGHIPQDVMHGVYSQALALADGFTSDSQAILNELHTVRGCEHIPDHIFRFGVNPDLFFRHEDTRFVFDELGIPHDGLLIFSARSLRAAYNHETLVRAMPAIMLNVPNAYFLFVNNHGHRYPDAADYIGRIKAMIRSNDLLGRVRFVDHIPHDRMPQFYSSAFATISIPLEDGFPATIFEAMACESPLVVSDLPDYAGVVHANSAMLIQPEDHEGLAHAVVRLASNQKFRESLIANGLQIARTHGGLDSEVDRLMKFYEEIASV